MKIFFDAEFTGLHKDTTLISLGLVSEENDLFYAEFNDYDTNQINDWLKENIINKLIYNNDENFTKTSHELRPNGYSAKVKGSSKNIKEALLEWLDQFDDIEWVADVCHYDFVLLIDLLYGDALNVPDNVCAACHDLNQDIARYYKCSEKEAFDKSRDELSKDFDKKSLDMSQHNSLYDAIIARYIYNKINK